MDALVCLACAHPLEPAAPDLFVCDACGRVLHGACRASARDCPGCALPRPRDHAALALGVLGLVAAAAGLVVFNYVTPRSPLWPPCSVVAGASGLVSLGLSHGRPPAGLARTLALLALALCFPPLVVATILLFGLLALVVVLGSRKSVEQRLLEHAAGVADD